MFEAAADKADGSAALFQLPRQEFSGVGIRVADGFRIEYPGNLSAVLAQLQCMEQMFIAVCEGRIHQDQVVALAGMIIQEIIMDHPKALANQNGTQVGIEFYAVDVASLSISIASNGIFKQIAATGARFEDGFNAVPIHGGQQLSGDFRRSRIEFMVGFGKCSGGGLIRCSAFALLLKVFSCRLQ